MNQADIPDRLVALLMVSACDAAIASFRDIAAHARTAVGKLQGRSGSTFAAEAIAEIGKAADESERKWSEIRAKYAPIAGAKT